MAQGKWFILPRGFQGICALCGDLITEPDTAYETAKALYCSEGCADDAEVDNDSLSSGLVCDYPD